MDVKTFYAEIKGSYNDALAIMMNDVLIARMLGKFINGDSIDQMIVLYENKDFRGLFAAAHSLKGVAGNLALTPIFDLASFITEATRNDDNVNLDKEIAELKNLNERLRENYSKYIA